MTIGRTHKSKLNVGWENGATFAVLRSFGREQEGQKLSDEVIEIAELCDDFGEEKFRGVVFGGGEDMPQLLSAQEQGEI